MLLRDLPLSIKVRLDGVDEVVNCLLFGFALAIDREGRAARGVAVLLTIRGESDFVVFSAHFDGLVSS